jgi:hypothetical protein
LKSPAPGGKVVSYGGQDAQAKTPQLNTTLRANSLPGSEQVSPTVKDKEAIERNSGDRRQNGGSRQVVRTRNASLIRNSQGGKDDMASPGKVPRSQSDRMLLQRHEKGTSDENNGTAEGNQVKPQDLCIDDYEVDEPIPGQSALDSERNSKIQKKQIPGLSYHGALRQIARDASKAHMHPELTASAEDLNSEERQNETEKHSSPLKSPHLLLKERLNHGQQRLEEEQQRLSTVNEVAAVTPHGGVIISETQASGDLNSQIQDALQTGPTVDARNAEGLAIEMFRTNTTATNPNESQVNAQSPGATQVGKKCPTFQNSRLGLPSPNAASRDPITGPISSIVESRKENAGEAKAEFSFQEFIAESVENKGAPKSSVPLKTINDQSEVSDAEGEQEKTELTVSKIGLQKKKTTRASRKGDKASIQSTENALYDRRVLKTIHQSRGIVGGPSHILNHNFRTDNLEGQFEKDFPLSARKPPLGA